MFQIYFWLSVMIYITTACVCCYYIMYRYIWLLYKLYDCNIKIDIDQYVEQNNITKYVVYYKEFYDVKKKSYREYFKIENHPLNIDNKLYNLNLYWIFIKKSLQKIFFIK